MLAERTAEHEYLYPDGISAALFSTPDELVDKARHYVADPESRLRVAANGHERCMKLGLSWQDHMRREWSLAEMILESGSDNLPQTADAPFWRGFRKGSLPVGLSQVLQFEPEIARTTVAGD